MDSPGERLMLFTGRGSPKLAKQIAKKLNTELSKAAVGAFSDGECSVNITDSVRGADVFVVQSTSKPVNNNLMELLVMIDALKRASAARITAVIPYFGYARQDRKARPRDPITAKLVANMLVSAGADRVLTMDLHAPQLQGFFDIPVDHLFGIPVLIDYLKKSPVITDNKDNLVVVSPDVGSANRARAMAGQLNESLNIHAALAIVDKRRPKANQAEVMNIVGDVKGKICLIVDDMIDTAGTITQGAKALKEIGGAKEVYACCTHGVLSGPALERLDKSAIDKLFILDTIDKEDKDTIPKITHISVAPIFAKAIHCIFTNQRVSKLY